MAGAESETMRDRLRALVEAAHALEATAKDLERFFASPPADMPRNGPGPRATADDGEPQGGPAPQPRDGSLTAAQRRICERVISVFETGTPEGKYGAISIYNDGPDRRRQITYGRWQTTEYSNLRELVEMYANAGGTFSSQLAPYVTRIEVTPLVDDETFKNLLRQAGDTDPVMRSTQDAFFDRRYFQPALAWARQNGFVLPLSILVIYDSFIHSGSILGFLRQRFAAVPPARGGDERTWVSEYVRVRHDWLSNHSNPDVRPSNYRTADLLREIANANWNLATPIVANGVAVFDSPGTRSAAGDHSDHEHADDWCEVEAYPPPAPRTARDVARGSAADLAGRILRHPRIRLATQHASGIADDANARQNIIDTAEGRSARRSSYNGAPGGTVNLSTDMLRGVLTLADTYSFEVSEFCGGKHGDRSRHYLGVSADISYINGQHIEMSHPSQLAFRAACTSLGATEVLGPGNAGHATHIHAAWPRPAA